METTNEQTPKKKKKFWKIALGMIITGVVGIGGYAAYKLWPRDISVSLDSSSDPIVVTVNTSISPSDLKENYQVVVYNHSNKVHTYLKFDGVSKKVTYEMIHLLDGQRYTFQLMKNDLTIPKSIKWSTPNTYTKPQTIVEEAIKVTYTEVSISRIDVGTPDYERKVWNGVKIMMRDKEQKYSYSIGNMTQDKPVFNGLKPGDYEVVVTNSEGVEDRQPLSLARIENRGTPLTKEQIQSVFDKVSNKLLSVSEAKNMLSVGPVKLANSVQNGEITTLFELLDDAYNYQTKVTIVSFDIDPNTNKIKSGTLKVRI